MKENRTTPIPVFETLTPSGPERIYFNHGTTEREGEIFHTADFVEVEQANRENMIIALIRERYSINNEAALIRKMIVNEDVAEFNAYNDYVNECKAIADSIFND